MRPVPSRLAGPGAREAPGFHGAPRGYGPYGRHQDPYYRSGRYAYDQAYRRYPFGGGYVYAPDDHRPRSPLDRHQAKERRSLRRHQRNERGALRW